MLLSLAERKTKRLEFEVRKRYVLHVNGFRTVALALECDEGRIMMKK